MTETKLPDVTLLFLLQADEVLLAMKKRRFGEGRWNGVGGKLESGETIEAGLVRETREEIGVGVEAADFEQVAELDFYFPPGPKAKWNQRVHVFVTRVWQGEPTESEEMRPQWFPLQQLPFEAMWSGDDLWIPQALAGQFVTGSLKFGDDETIVSHELKVRVR